MRSFLKQHLGWNPFGGAVHTNVGDVAQLQPTALIAQDAVGSEPGLFEHPTQGNPAAVAQIPVHDNLRRLDCRQQCAILSSKLWESR
jgi:hypothetical protein